MSYQFCRLHNKVSAWGCPVCRKIAMREAMENAVEEASEAIREAFRAIPVATHKDEGHGRK